MSLRSRLLAAFLFMAVPIALVPTVGMAQQSKTSSGSTVYGSVLDPDNAVIPGATVTLTPAAGKALTATSKTDGTFSFHGVAPGTYSLSATARGFADFSKPAIQVVAGVNLAVDASMALQTQQQQVNVSTNSVQLSVNPDNNASSTVISGAALNALSDDPDDLLSELQALAGPSAGPNGGQIYIDGFTGGQLPPKSDILSIRINQNPFSAQYPEIGYGRIEVLTKPGTEQLHGFATAQFRDKFLNTSTPFLGAANQQPAYHTLFFMGNVTGPIRNGMSFTLSGSHRTMDNNAIINPPGGFYASSATSTTLCAPGDLSCNSYPFPTTARAESTPRTRWDISPRIDTMLGSKNTLTVRYQYEANTSSVNPTVSSALLTPSSSSGNDQRIQASETQLWSSKVVNETRFEYQRNTSKSITPGTGPSINVSGGFNVSSGSLSHSTGDHEEFQNYTSIQLVKNFVRFGVRLTSSGESSFSNGGSYGSLTYNYLLDPCTDPSITNKPSHCASSAAPPCSLANMTGGTPLYSSYQCNVVNQFGIKDIKNFTIGARETDVGFYAEDDWKALPNLTFSYGIRLEAQNAINSTHDMAPRFSIAYGIPRKNGQTTTVLRGGFGIFFSRFGLGSIQGQIANNGVNSVNKTYPNASFSTDCQPAYSGGFFTGFSPDCETGAGTTAFTTPTLNAPGLRSAYTMESTASVEQQVGKNASVTLTYLNARGFHQYMTLSLPVGQSSTQINDVNQSEGIYRQNQLNANLNYRTPSGINIGGYYSANWANTNTDNITDPFNSAVDYGRAGYAVRSRLVLFGSIPLPFNISASPFITAQSGSPYNITTGLQDSVTLGYSDRPSWNPAAGPMPAHGSFAQCTDASNFTTANGLNLTNGTNTQIPVNFCTGPARVSFNLRLAKTIGFGPKTGSALSAADAARQAARQGGGFRGGGRHGGWNRGGSNTGRKYNLSLGAQAFNLFNEVPYGNPTSTVSNPEFGKTLSLSGSSEAVRQITLQASFNF